MPNHRDESQLELWNTPSKERDAQAEEEQASLDLGLAPASRHGQKRHLHASFAEKRPLNLLVADDNEINRKVIRVILEKLGYPCREATNGLEALDLYKADSSIDYIFMDVDMPEMTGLEAARAIRSSEGEGAPDQAKEPAEIIAVTANVSDETRRACRRAGMNGYLEKPITAEMVKAQLLRSWSRKQKRRATHSATKLGA